MSDEHAFPEARVSTRIVHTQFAQRENAGRTVRFLDHRGLHPASLEIERQQVSERAFPKITFGARPVHASVDLTANLAISIRKSTNDGEIKNESVDHLSFVTRTAREHMKRTHLNALCCPSCSHVQKSLSS